MRFILTQDIQQNPIIKTGVFWLIISSLAFIFFGLSYDYLQFGMTPESIVHNINGNPEVYLEPMPLDAMVLDTHIRLFLLLILTLVLFSILFRTPLGLKQKIYWTNFTYITILLDSISPYLVRYISSLFSFLKIVSLYALSLSIVTLCFYLLIYLIRKPQAHV